MGAPAAGCGVSVDAAAENCAGNKLKAESSSYQEYQTHLSTVPDSRSPVPALAKMGKTPAANRTQDVLVAREFRTEAEKLPWHTTGNQRRTESYVARCCWRCEENPHR